MFQELSNGDVFSLHALYDRIKIQKRACTKSDLHNRHNDDAPFAKKQASMSCKSRYLSLDICENCGMLIYGEPLLHPDITDREEMTNVNAVQTHCSSCVCPMKSEHANIEQPASHKPLCKCPQMVSQAIVSKKHSCKSKMKTCSVCASINDRIAKNLRNGQVSSTFTKLKMFVPKNLRKKSLITSLVNSTPIVQLHKLPGDYDESTSEDEKEDRMKASWSEFTILADFHSHTFDRDISLAISRPENCLKKKLLLTPRPDLVCPLKTKCNVAKKNTSKRRKSDDPYSLKKSAEKMNGQHTHPEDKVSEDKNSYGKLKLSLKRTNSDQGMHAEKWVVQHKPGENSLCNASGMRTENVFPEKCLTGGGTNDMVNSPNTASSRTSNTSSSLTPHPLTNKDSSFTNSIKKREPILSYMNSKLSLSSNTDEKSASSPSMYKIKELNPSIISVFRKAFSNKLKKSHSESEVERDRTTVCSDLALKFPSQLSQFHLCVEAEDPDTNGNSDVADDREHIGMPQDHTLSHEEHVMTDQSYPNDFSAALKPFNLYQHIHSDDFLESAVNSLSSIQTETMCCYEVFEEEMNVLHIPEVPTRQLIQETDEAVDGLIAQLEQYDDSSDLSHILGNHTALQEHSDHGMSSIAQVTLPGIPEVTNEVTLSDGLNDLPNNDVNLSIIGNSEGIVPDDDLVTVSHLLSDMLDSLEMQIPREAQSSFVIDQVVSLQNSEHSSLFPDTVDEEMDSNQIIIDLPSKNRNTSQNMDSQQIDDDKVPKGSFIQTIRITCSNELLTNKTEFALTFPVDIKLECNKLYGIVKTENDLNVLTPLPDNYVPPEDYIETSFKIPIQVNTESRNMSADDSNKVPNVVEYPEFGENKGESTYEIQTAVKQKKTARKSTAKSARVFPDGKRQMRRRPRPSYADLDIYSRYSESSSEDSDHKGTDRLTVSEQSIGRGEPRKRGRPRKDRVNRAVHAFRPGKVRANNRGSSSPAKGRNIKTVARTAAKDPEDNAGNIDNHKETAGMYCIWYVE